MQINDSRGRALGEVTVALEPEELTELLVSASQLEGGGVSHTVMRDQAGNAFAIYRDTGEPAPLERHFDWWLGPVMLAGFVLMAVGAYTVARGIVGLLF